jgi:cytidylate kinase
MAAMESFETGPVIALDGLSGSGKSTLARMLAVRLNWAYLDSGAWYRALTWAVLREGLNPAESKNVLAVLSRIQISCTPDGSVLVDGHLLSDEIRQPRIDSAVPDVADHLEVRNLLTKKMRELLDQPSVKGVVADGRDAGTVIFPNAGLKVFVETSLEERASRRFTQLSELETGDTHSFQEVLDSMSNRDRRDSTRGIHAPRPLQDGQVLDNNQINADQAVERLIDMASRAGVPMLS